MSSLVNFTKEEKEQLKELGLSPVLHQCDLSPSVYISKLDRGFDIYEPYSYYDTEGEACTGTSRLWVETFPELIKILKKRTGK